jgi:hypothetical protein
MASKENNEKRLEIRKPETQKQQCPTNHLLGRSVGMLAKRTNSRCVRGLRKGK